MILNKYLLLLILLILFAFPGSCFAEENYYIDDEPVLMYKIIDWWEDCSLNRKHIFNMKPDASETQQAFEQRKKKAFSQYKDCDSVNGKVLKYNIIDKVNIEYHKEKQELNIIFDEDIAVLLTGNRQSGSEPASLVFKCIRLNEKTFSPSDIFNCGYAKINKNILVFMNISPEDALKIKNKGPEIGA